MDINVYHNQVREQFSREEYRNNIESILNNFSNTHYVYFIVGFEPINKQTFMEFITNKGCHMMGFIYLKDSAPCTVVLIPKSNHLFVKSELLAYSDIHVVKHDFVCIDGSMTQTRKNLSERMFPEHIKMFKL